MSAASTQGASTAATGPWGAHFEGQVAAFYMMAMLSGAPPRGLPGTVIKKVALQQANSGRPLDDVIVHAVDGAGKPAVLEIQVKRTIKFADADVVFKKVVGQIVEASRRPDFWTTRYCLAIATARSSSKIDGPIQDVLALARQIGDAATFALQLKLAGVANDQMRAFVRTFQRHLESEGAANDDETTWKLLQRLQVMTFDFAAAGSVSEDLARERALRTLHTDDAPRVDAFWGNLVEMALNIAKSGGDKDRVSLLESLHPLGFRFAEDRRHASVRQALAEQATQTLSDIDDRVGRVRLMRHERVSAVRDALDVGRYVEVRGDAGVGKSGVLRQFAESMQAETNVLVLAPGRCAARGWTSMRAELGFEGTLQELLVELANDGGAIVFVDNLDSFSTDERHTVVDVIRAAASVSAISILATARSEFGVDEASWLPIDAIERLKSAPAVVIDTLSKAEVEQLTTSNPALTPLLSEAHPALQVTRNLFRLARIAVQPTADPLPHTEAEMASQWWDSADGPRDSGWRDRSRLLRYLGRQALTKAHDLDVAAHPAHAIDALVKSGSLRNLVPDRVSFRHDVLREWAIACMLNEEADLLNVLDLNAPASATHGRGLEIAARMIAERSIDSVQWNALLLRLSVDGKHKSWRRAALLAPARSEAADVLLPKLQIALFSDGGLLVRELVRTVMAVEVVSATAPFAAAGLDPKLIPAGMTMPRGPSWLALVLWLLSVGDDVPPEAVPEVADLYVAFSVGTLGLTPVTPLSTSTLYRWLRLMEPRSAPPAPEERPRFWECLDRTQIQPLLESLRNGFLMFARTTPDLAAEYLEAVIQSEHNDNLVREILRLRGSLAQAAPLELARLTENALIERPRLQRRHFSVEGDEPFTYHDHDFIPPSPAQGPFFELLQNSPSAGLALIHRLVGHAINSVTGTRDPEADAVRMPFGTVERAFPWQGTYLWPRHSNYYAVTSSLMALEAWAHRRIEACEPFETVLNDVLGPPGSCAAFLLVAVDLTISHWPKSIDSAIDLLGCPELLCLDHSRQVHDQFEPPDFFNLNAMQVEPRGQVSIAELKQRPSRGMTLDGLIGNLALSGMTDRLAKLKAKLARAVERLEKPTSQSNLGDPEFMVRHALNLANPDNWVEADARLRDGSVTKFHKYVSPADEERHFQALRDAAAPESFDFKTQGAIALAVDNRSHFSAGQLEAAVTWASRTASNTTEGSNVDEDDAAERMKEEAVLTAAMLVMRDGDATLLETHGDWARQRLMQAIASDAQDPVHQMRPGLRFNPPAIAFAGLLHAEAKQKSNSGTEVILRVAASDHHAAAHGFGAAISDVAESDPRLPRAVLRCAISACISPYRRWDASDEEKDARKARKAANAEKAVQAEMAWLRGNAEEPAWPAFPTKGAQPRRRLRLPVFSEESNHPAEPERQRHEIEVHHQTAALWLRQIQSLGNADAPPWLLGLADAYMPWTIEANGGALDEDEETDDPPSEWNATFLALLARCATDMSTAQVRDLVTTPIAGLPEQSFLDLSSEFLRNFDSVYFGGAKVDASLAVDVRTVFAERLIECWRWKQLRGTKESSIERHLAVAIATQFFNDYNWISPTKTYLLKKGVDRIGPFLPLLSKLAADGPSTFVAIVLLNLLEVSPKPEHLEVLAQAGLAWHEAYPDSRSFWIDHGVGKRWCGIIESTVTGSGLTIAKDSASYLSIERVVVELVGLGIAEASALEATLTTSKT